jgi:hypothetical protein
MCCLNRKYSKSSMYVNLRPSVVTDLNISVCMLLGLFPFRISDLVKCIQRPLFQKYKMREH